MKTDFRLKHNRSFNYIYRKGKGVPSANLTVIFVPARSLLVGLTVGKKVGNSVTRNLIKRRLREAVRTVLPNIAGNYNIIIVAKPSITAVSFASICAELKSALARAGIFSEQK